MEKNRGSKVIAIIALIVAVVGLSLGFAAFSQTLTINSSAEYTPGDDSFKVQFSGSKGSITTSVTPEVTGATGKTATITNGTDPVINNLGATFTAPGQSVVYSFYVANTGSVDAYLNNVVFNEVTTGSGFKVCKPNTTNSNAAHEDTITAACGDISVKVQFGNVTTTASKSGISNEKIGYGEYKNITITIKYANENAAADGDFTVEFGSIALDFDSTD